MGRASYLASLALALGLSGCGGGPAIPAPAPSLPPLDRYSTDLAENPQAGTAASPLVLGSPRCPFQPFVVWQTALCTLTVPQAWPQSNAFATTLDPFRWRVVINVENAWDLSCNSGPPAQSLPLTDPAVIATFGPDFAMIGVELADQNALCRKIPYVAIAYVRGVQGDPVRRMAAWGSMPILTFDGTLIRTTAPTFAQAVHFWVHLRTPAGVRYMAHTHLWQSGYEPDDFTLNWNWPARDSYYYPGAWIHGGDSSICPGSVSLVGNTWAVNLERLTDCRFPNLAAERPDILGFEIAVEGAFVDYSKPSGPNRVTFMIQNPMVTGTP